MGFYTIELPEMPKEIENMNDLLLWCKFINSESEEEFEMLATKNESIEVAYIELQRLRAYPLITIIYLKAVKK